jgi:hypothetical protein
MHLLLPSTEAIRPHWDRCRSAFAALVTIVQQYAALRDDVNTAAAAAASDRRKVQMKNAAPVPSVVISTAKVGSRLKDMMSKRTRDDDVFDLDDERPNQRRRL